MAVHEVFQDVVLEDAELLGPDAAQGSKDSSMAVMARITASARSAVVGVARMFS